MTGGRPRAGAAGPLSDAEARILRLANGAPPAPGDAPAARLELPPGHDLVTVIDTLVAGVHYPVDSAAADVGYKACAVNLSDLAAMGAAPLGATASVVGGDDAWRADCALGMRDALAGVPLLAVRAIDGPASVTVQAFGHVPAGGALLRGGARPGDGVYVTGTLGDAGLALAAIAGAAHPGRAAAAAARARLDRPTARLAAGQALVGVASAAIDVSDGLVRDLGRVVRASGAGARIEVERLPLSAELREALPGPAGWRLAAAAGDDYELCFTLPDAARPRLAGIEAAAGCPLTRIGAIEARAGVRWVTADGSPFEPGTGYQHAWGRG